jgi:hypothetical protein
VRGRLAGTLSEAHSPHSSGERATASGAVSAGSNPAGGAHIDQAKPVLSCENDPAPIERLCSRMPPQAAPSRQSRNIRGMRLPPSGQLSRTVTVDESPRQQTGTLAILAAHVDFASGDLGLPRLAREDHIQQESDHNRNVEARDGLLSHPRLAPFHAVAALDLAPPLVLAIQLQALVEGGGGVITRVSTTFGLPQAGQAGNAVSW